MNVRPQASGSDEPIAACDHDWRDIDGRWLCIECRAEKPYASDAAFVRRFAYWLVTGGDGDLPWGLRLFWKLITWSVVAILVYVLLTTPHLPMLGYVVMSVLAFCFVLMALFTRLGED